MIQNNCIKILLLLLTIDDVFSIKKLGILNFFNIDSVCNISPTKNYCTNENLLFNKNKQKCYLSRVFPKTNIIIFNECSKEFIETNFNPDIFPNLEKVIFNKSPVYQENLEKFDINDEKIKGYYTDSLYIKSKDKSWMLENMNMRKIDIKEYDKYIKKFTIVDPEFYK